MGVFNDMLKSGESLIKNEIALDYGYIPKLVPYRESQMRAIAASIKPLFQNRSGRNMFVYGPPGVGKTVAVKHLLKEIEEESENITPFYINCWQKNTAFKILVEMCDIIGYKFIQNKRTEELFAVLKQYLNKSERSAVFAFDEIDKIEDLDFIYNLLEDVFRKSVILITNYKEYVTELDERIKSRLTAEMLEFQAYNLNETRGILKQRMEYAFVPGIWEEDAVESIVQKTAKMSDIRSGLYMMKEAALIAEERSSKKVNSSDVSTAMKKLDDFSIKKTEELEDEVKFILKIIKDNTGKRIGEVYKTYQENGGKLVYKTFWRKINKLEEDKFITTKKIEGGKEGKTTIINYGQEKKLTEF
ncbi:hypothetical protein CMO88_00315 [Candidatus Woesearchaeota archaeon]|nr:hypothetical protein [Candidatus Woesearchaeota archaeon]|tara:strand:- start:61568 stop:62644 length:1077 start_codon:yes stop_codon:yes gene_type:complete